MTRRPTPFPSILSLLSAALLTGCSGTSFENADAAVGGHSGLTGGASATGGKSSIGGSTAIGAGGTGVCCNAIPVCSAGDTQLTNPDACPSGTQCYSLSLCCTQIYCAKGASACNPTSDFNLHYVSTSATQCEVIDFACPTNTTMFGNACGCGCQQSASCPQYVDCMPGTAARSSLCSDTTTCPYTVRAM